MAIVSVCLACIIAGEAGICDLQTQIAVAHVWHNRQAAGIVGGWYGWSVPKPTQIFIAENYHKFADPTSGALMLVSDADLPRVTRYIANLRQTFISQRCANGQRLYGFGP